ncbi:MAG: hypothetical protein LBS12_00945 [Prevotellaceae bacterium]|jgi:hypothetical protein|nr:hypothetical protein [Prevotellaceae bacterium]
MFRNSSNIIEIGALEAKSLTAPPARHRTPAAAGTLRYLISTALSFGKPSLSFGKPSLSFGKLSLSFGKLSLSFGKPSRSLGKPSLSFGKYFRHTGKYLIYNQYNLLTP